MNKLISGGVAAALALSANFATASMVPAGGSLTIANSYTNATPASVAASSALVNDVSGNAGASYRYGNGWGTSQTAISASGVPAGTYGFYDSFVFQIMGSQANSITSVINLSSGFTNTDLKNLDVQLFTLSSVSSLPALTASTNVPDSVGFTSYNLGPNGSGTTEVLSTTAPLSAGKYVLEIRGLVDGVSGGSYTGSLNIAPVPLPAAAWLLLSGLGGLAAAKRRKQSLAGAVAA